MQTNTVSNKPLRSQTLAYGTYDVYAERPSGHRATHPINGQDLGEAMDRLTRVKEHGKRVWWHIGKGVGSDGCAYGGGQIFKTKRAAVKSWTESAPESLAVGCGVFHRGEHGTIESYLPETYDVPMFTVRFGQRLAILKPSELGAA